MRILVAEDEPSTRTAYNTALEAKGHFVIATENGGDCIAVYKEYIKRERSRRSASNNLESFYARDQSIVPSDTVILDYRMPKRDGMHVAKEILNENPKQRIIFASAYVEDTLRDEIKKLATKVELIQKPFKMSALIDLLEDKELLASLKSYGVNIPHVKQLHLSHRELVKFCIAIRRFMEEPSDHN
jgi:CheY-like chemotaxis protein